MRLPPPRGRVQGRVWVVLAFVVILGAGCSIINAVLTTRASLSNAGWHVVATNIQGGTGHGADGTLVVGVDYRSAVVISAHAEASDVAHIIWDKTPGRFSFLKVTVDNAPGAVVRSPTYVFSHIQLVALFGPRPDKLDANALVNLAGLGREVVLGAATALVVITLITLLVVWLVRRSRRWRAATSPDWGGWSRHPPLPPSYPPQVPNYAPPPPPPPPAWPVEPVPEQPEASNDRRD